jgi:hypothetical protein
VARRLADAPVTAWGPIVLPLAGIGWAVVIGGNATPLAVLEAEVAGADAADPAFTVATAIGGGDALLAALLHLALALFLFLSLLLGACVDDWENGEWSAQGQAAQGLRNAAAGEAVAQQAGEGVKARGVQNLQIAREIGVMRSTGCEVRIQRHATFATRQNP